MRAPAEFTRSQRFKICVLLSLGFVHIAVTLFTVIPGYLSIDEAFYHWMTKSFSETGSLALSNGYEEYPSLELVHPYVNLSRGRLFPPHPYLFPILATPLYNLFGFRGLFMVNALAFLGVALLCFLTALRLFRDRDLALNSCLILVTATFAWEYSQAAWPHCLAMLFVSAAFFLFVCAYEPTHKAHSGLWALSAGIMAGFAMGIRLDTVLVVPALTLPFLFSRPWRPKAALMVGVGLLPGAVALALTNMTKFGSLSLFSYGQEGLMVYNRPTVPSKELMVVALCPLVIAWAVSRASFREKAHWRGRTLIGLTAVATVLGVWGVAHSLPTIESTIEYALDSLIDVRLLDPKIVFSPMTRTTDGGVIYLGAHKKALLQSLPFLGVLVIPFVQMVRGVKGWQSLALLFLIPLTVTAYFSYAFLAGEAGGGLCLNQRYLLYGLPFLCVLAGYGVRYVTSSWDLRSLIIFAIPFCVATAGLYFLLTAAKGSSLDRLELPLLSIPLVIAGSLALIAVLVLIKGPDKARALGLAVWLLLVVAFTWSALVAFAYDYPGHRLARKSNYDFGRILLNATPADSLFLAGPGFFTVSVSLIEKPGIWIAYPARDRFQDLPGLLGFDLSSGRRAFGIFRNRLWNDLKLGPLKSYKIIPVRTYGDFFIAEITLP